MKLADSKKKKGSSKNIKRAVQLGILGALLGTTLYYGKKIKEKEKINMHYSKLNNTKVNNLDVYTAEEILKKDIVNRKNELLKCQKELFAMEDIEDENIEKYKKLLKEKTMITIALSKKLGNTLDDYYKDVASKKTKGGHFESHGKLNLAREYLSIEKQHLLDDLNYIKINLQKCLIDKRDIKKRYKIILADILMKIKKQEQQSQLYKDKQLYFEKKI